MKYLKSVSEVYYSVYQHLPNFIGCASTHAFELISSQFFVVACYSFVFLYPEHTGVVTGVAFGEHAQFLTSTGMDRSLKFYSL